MLQVGVDLIQLNIVVYDNTHFGEIKLLDYCVRYVLVTPAMKVGNG